MKLYLLRHARAEVRRDQDDDAARALTRSGRKRLLRCSAGLRALGWAPELLLHSPWLRAVQTAEVVASAARAIEVHAGLARAPDEALIAELAARGVESACLVGHEPWLSELAGLLCHGDRRCGHAYELKKAGVIELHGESRPHGMHVAAVLPPRVLRRIAPAALAKAAERRR